MRQYDKNKNGVLDREEWAELSGPLREADRNGDGIITLDELIQKLLEMNGQSPAGKPALGSTNGHRIPSAQERLPKGLPDWFYEKDLDKNGQVTMAEYCSPWSEDAAREFAKWDLNNDGIITPAEALKVLGDKGKK